jgi:hypothetical protein
LESEKDVTQEARAAVLEVIQNMGFKEQLGRSHQTAPARPELAIVQDAGEEQRLVARLLGRRPVVNAFFL